jgi:hypothetical protein
MNSETITLIANIALAVSAIIALVFGIVQVQSANRDRQERLTLEALRNFNTREFSELMNYVTAHNIPPTHEKWQKLPAAEGVMITQFAQEMESLGLLVAERLINIDLVDKTIGSLVSVTWEKYKPMIQDSREKRPDPFLSEYFQWLAERIDERMRNTPRKPFYVQNCKFGI